MTKNHGVMTRCGYIAILGAPNAGKSTLINRLVGGKVSIVTPKAQTTRVRVRGVCAHVGAQLIFIDTPGIFATGRAFEKSLVREAWAGARDANLLLLLVDATQGLDEETQRIVERLQKEKDRPVLLALNKVDAVKKPYLLKLATACDAYGVFEHIFMISARSGDGVEDMKAALAGMLPEGPWLYPADQMTDVSMRELASEITREKLFLLLRQELPYSLKVETELWEEREGGARIAQIVHVEREGQKKIVIGEGGKTLKRVGTSARLELERIMSKRVRLELFVRVNPQWKERG